MEIQITGKNIELTDAIKQYVNEKIGGLEKFYNKIRSARVELEKCAPRNNNNNFRVLINFDVPNDLLRVDQTEGDLYAAIDFAREELESQLKKYKEKYSAKRKKGRVAQRLLKSVFFWKNEEAAVLNTEKEDDEE
jgi:putative sigma-54 modulation protein